MSRRKAHKPRRPRPSNALASNQIPAASPPRSLAASTDRPDPGPGSTGWTNVATTAGDLGAAPAWRAHQLSAGDTSLGRLVELVAARELARQAVDAEVLSLRRQRVSWTAIGAALGVSRQAARQHYTVPIAAESRDPSTHVHDGAPRQPTDSHGGRDDGQPRA